MLDVATRVDTGGAYREEISFPPVGGTRMFNVAHLPSGPTEAGLVICPPILMDFLKNYRHEVLLARTLASRGIAVQRFHYRGTGHSEGDEGEIRQETMVEDALAASERLCQQHGVRKIAFLGTRWGARVATAAAREYPGAPLVLWEPVAVAGRYVRELIMGRLLRETKDPRFVGAPAAGETAGEVDQAGRWDEEIAREGRVDILGYALHRWLYESTAGPALDVLLANGGPRSVFLLQIGQWNTLRPDLLRVKRAIEAASGVCEDSVIRDEPGWMFAGHRLKEAQRLIQISADWLVAQMGVASNA